MENNIVNGEQPVSSVEKISKTDLKTEQNKMSLEENTPVNNFINTVMSLNDKELDKAIAFINKKLEILKKNK